MGAGPLEGAMIATSRNRLNAYMTGEGIGSRSLSGRVDATQQTMTLEGVDQNGTRIRISATKQ